MSNIDPGQWRRLSRILDAALELPPERRAAYLDEACAGDFRLRSAAESMLVAADHATDFLDRQANVPASLLHGRSSEEETIKQAGRGPDAATLSPLSGADRFLPGSVVGGRYRIVSLLGRGGMGEVYRADDLKLGQPVALKFLPKALASDPVRRERFFAEVRITRQLAHPNICRVYDIAEFEDQHFLSMEYIDGEDLASLIKRIGYLSNEKALEIARQLAAGL